MDSAQHIAHLRIRSWDNGPYKRFYKEAFQKIREAGTAYAVLDLRDNTGGRLEEIQHLYSYLVDKPFQFLQETETKTKIPHVKKFFAPNSGVFDYFLNGLATPFLAVHNLIMSRTENGKRYFKLSYEKMAKPNRLNFKGKVYVLINGVSFSASSILAISHKFG